MCQFNKSKVWILEKNCCTFLSINNNSFFSKSFHTHVFIRLSALSASNVSFVLTRNNNRCRYTNGMGSRNFPNEVLRHVAFLIQPLPRAQRNRAIRRIAAWEIGRPGYLYAPSFITPWIRAFQKRETNYHPKWLSILCFSRYFLFLFPPSPFFFRGLPLVWIIFPKRIKRSSIELSYHTFSPLRNNLKSKKWE